MASGLRPGRDRDAGAVPGRGGDVHQLAPQVVRRGVGDPDRGVGARAGSGSAGKWTSLFWRVRPVSTAGSLRDGPSTTTSSMRPTRASWRSRAERSTTTREPLEALGDDLGRDELVGPLGRLGAGTGRVDERVGAVVAGLGDHLEGALEVVVGLAGEADDDVGGDGQVGARRPGPRPSRSR